MRVISSFIVLSLLLLALLPGAASVPFAHDATPVLNELDVCHGGSGSMNIDFPYFLVSPRVSLRLEVVDVVTPLNDFFQPYLLAISDERPPEVVSAVHS